MAKELVIDATCGSNCMGKDAWFSKSGKVLSINHLVMSLSAVLVELDGTRLPLCYLFIGVDNPDGISKSADPGATTWILERFDKPPKDAGFSLTFFGCDKDRSEINAIQLVWPSVKSTALLLACKQSDQKEAQRCHNDEEPKITI